MKKSTKIISLLLSVALSVGIFTSALSANAVDKISVTLDGVEIDFDVEPQIIDGRTLVPLRKIFEEIGALVKWDGETRTVSARKNSKTITLTIGSADMLLDKGKTDDAGNPIIETVTLDVPAQIFNGRTLVPVGAISESFGLNVDWDDKNHTVVITDDDVSDEAWKKNTGTINLTDLTYTGEGIEITDNQIKITKGGDFTVTGTLDDGNITVNTQDRVKIRLSGADITSSTGSPIYFEKADKAYITITDGTENSLTAQDSESDALYSKENLEIKGDGTLTISANGGHAIKASDNLTIENGVLNLASESDGIHINDTFKMIGGTVNISAIGDGIDSESIVIIEGGALNIETKGTPITQTVITTDEATETNSNVPAWNNMPGGFMDEADVEFEKSSKGINAEWMMVISGGDITVNSASHAIHCQDEIEIKGGTFTISSTYDKGVSAHGNLTIDGEDTVIDITKSTEGLESKNVMTINNGTIDIVASDDGLNATGGNAGFGAGGGVTFDRQQNNAENTDGTQWAGDRQNRPNKNWNNAGGEAPAMPENGEMPTLPGFENGEMPTPPENGEMQMPDFANGENGPQGGGGGMMGGFGRDMKECLIINGGDIEIIANDDCLDANGNLVLNGGFVKAIKENGSFTGAFGVFDPDGQLVINEGASFIIAGSGGNVTTTENQISVYSETTHNADETITLKDSNGNVILEYAPKGSFSAVLISAPALEIGKVYTVSVGDENNEVTLSEQKAVIGTQTGGGMMGGFGGRPR